eukprot:2281103-Rhodomonas_salina.1
MAWNRPEALSFSSCGSCQRAPAYPFQASCQEAADSRPSSGHEDGKPVADSPRGQADSPVLAETPTCFTCFRRPNAPKKFCVGFLFTRGFAALLVGLKTGGVEPQVVRSMREAET